MLEIALTILMISIFSGVTAYAITWIAIMPGWYYKLKFKPFNCETCITFHLGWLWSFAIFSPSCLTIFNLALIMLTAFASSAFYPIVYRLCQRLLR